MNVMSIVSKIENLGLGVQGETLFVYQMPATCAKGILLKLPLIGTPIDHELPNYYRGTMQIIVRSPVQSEGDALAKSIMTALTLHGVTLLDGAGKGMSIKRMLPATLPIVYRRSDGNGIEWSLNFELVYTGID
jgi:hypothetical protein